MTNLFRWVASQVLAGKNHIISTRQGMLVMPEGFSDQALDAVSIHRSGHQPLGDRQPQPRLGARCAQDSKAPILVAPNLWRFLVQHLRKLSAGSQASLFSQTKGTRHRGLLSESWRLPSVYALWLDARWWWPGPIGWPCGLWIRDGGRAWVGSVERCVSWSKFLCKNPVKKTKMVRCG